MHTGPFHLLVPLLIACAPLAAQQTRASTHTPRTPGKLLVSGFGSDALHAYRAWDGAPRGSTTVPGAQSIVEGPDGLLYVCAEKIDEVWRVDPRTGLVVDAFVADDPATPEDENGPLNGPTAALFAPNGELIVTSFENDQILRFDGASGAYLGVLVAPRLGGLNGPDAGTKFGPDGLLYVPSFFTDSVLRYDAQGAFVDAFIPSRAGSLRQPRDLVLHQGQWYVASSQNGRILRYALDGTFVDVFATVAQPYSLAFHPDDGRLYVVSLSANHVRILDPDTGLSLGPIVSAGSGGLLGAVYLYFLRP